MKRRKREAKLFSFEEEIPLRKEMDKKQTRAAFLLPLLNEGITSKSLHFVRSIFPFVSAEDAISNLRIRTGRFRNRKESYFEVQMQMPRSR